MESPSPKANTSLVVSDASIGPSQSGEDPVVPQDGAENLDQDREYGCKYCHKKFSNKQALGGHQNAHKVERAMEKSARELHSGGSNFGYFSDGSSYADSYNRSSQFLNRPVINHGSYGYHHPVQHGAHIGYNVRPSVPGGAGDPYAPSRPLLGYNNVYAGWAGVLPRIPQFMNQHSSYMQNHPSNRFLTQGAGGPISRGSPPYGGSRFRPIRDHGSENNSGMNDPANPQVEGSDLDLSLKL